MSFQTELRQRITDKIVTALKEGCPPWKKPWGTGTSLPSNFVSKRRYSGVNVMLLDLLAMERGYTSSLWATYQQWASIGCQVKRRPADVPQGQWGAKVVFCKPITKVKKNDDGDEKKDKFFVLKEYVVFNLDQVEGPGLEQYRTPQPVPTAFVDYAPAEEAIKATKADIRYGGDKAFYRRGDDFIQIPRKETFHSLHEWYATHFHELAHWAECRVGWTGSYALGELIAEIASCYLATELGVPQSDDLTNHNAYLVSPWKLPKEHRRQARNNGACTASRATVDWLICNAYLYVGPSGDAAGCFGARGACGQGVVPANGLMYVNPTACDCGDYTRGYQAMSSRLPGKPMRDAERLLRGPAFDDVQGWKLAMPDTGWPIFLGDAQRRSLSAESLPAKLAILWQEKIVELRRDTLDADRRQSERHLGALSAPVAAGGCLLVAAPELHQVLAYEMETGTLRWRFQVAGKVDSPPTIVQDADSTNGLAIFGCDNGAVYALRLSDGELAWRFAAAATDGLAMLHGHLASATPLPGSVLVVGDTVVVAAGQHTDLGGLHFYALDAATGAVRASRVIAADQPAVVTNDILVADAAGEVWLGNDKSMLRLSATLDVLPVETTKIGTAANRPAISFDRQGSRIRFRTDVGRGGSTHGWKGAMRTSFVAAHRIASDDDVAFALKDPTASDRHPVRADKTPAVVAVTGRDEKRQVWGTSIGALGSRESYSALIKCGDRLYVGGGSRDGAAGCLQILDATTGKLLTTHELPSRVAECGLAATGGRLFVCCEGGEAVCFDEVK